MERERERYGWQSIGHHAKPKVVRTRRKPLGDEHGRQKPPIVADIRVSISTEHLSVDRLPAKSRETINIMNYFWPIWPLSRRHHTAAIRQGAAESDTGPERSLLRQRKAVKGPEDHQHAPRPIIYQIRRHGLLVMLRSTMVRDSRTSRRPFWLPIPRHLAARLMTLCRVAVYRLRARLQTEKIHLLSPAAIYFNMPPVGSRWLLPSPDK